MQHIIHPGKSVVLRAPSPLRTPIVRRSRQSKQCRWCQNAYNWVWKILFHRVIIIDRDTQWRQIRMMQNAWRALHTVLWHMSACRPVLQSIVLKLNGFKIHRWIYWLMIDIFCVPVHFTDPSKKLNIFLFSFQEESRLCRQIWNESPWHRFCARMAQRSVSCEVLQLFTKLLQYFFVIWDDTSGPVPFTLSAI
jgi:hypothetical protein